MNKEKGKGRKGEEERMRKKNKKITPCNADWMID